jgi:hypothetical protein
MAAGDAVRAMCHRLAVGQESFETGRSWGRGVNKRHVIDSIH